MRTKSLLPLFFISLAVAQPSFTAHTITASVDGNIKIAELVFSTTSIGSSTLDFLPECEMLDPDDNLIEIKGFAQGVVNAQ